MTTLRKLYKAERLHGTGEIIVGVFSNQGKRELLPGPSQAIWNHSPTGFEWGYGGSGPAQLALAILFDHTHDKEESVKYHQDFKRDFIATAPHSGFSIYSDQITLWLRKQKEEKHNERPSR